jgi:IgA Peptidase M64
VKNIFTILAVLFASLSGIAQDIDTLLMGGSTDNRINLVILGDGYRESELPNFRLDAQHTLDELFKQQPFQQYKNYFNAFAISVASKASGAATTPDKPIQNYYGSTFGYAGIDRLLVPTDESRIVEMLALTFPSYDQVLMIVNDKKYGGSGGWIATASTHALSVEIMIHELGHSFGSLADEYWAGPEYANEAPNMTAEKSDKKVRWKNWIGTKGIGMYPYAENRTWKHPHQHCKMEFLGEPFCAVCTETLVHRMHELTSFVESYTPEQDPIKPSNTFSLQLLEPIPNTLKVTWTLNKGLLPPTNDSEFTIAQEVLTSLPDTLGCEVMDTTLLNRRDEVFVTRVQWLLFSDITSDIGKYYIVRPGKQPDPPITGIPTEASNVSSVYPNPYDNKVALHYTLKRAQFVKVRVVDFSGKVVASEEVFQTAGEHRFEPNLQSLTTGVIMLYANDKWASFKILHKQ